MEQHETDEPELRMRSGRIGRIVGAGALAIGLAVGGYAVAGAATGSSTTAPAVASRNGATAPSIAGNGADGPHADGPHGGCPAGDPATMPHGPRETELTGDTATKVKAAALAAVPGGTVVRVETDSSGETPYEAHVKKSDGSFVVVQVKSDFSVATTHDGFGAPPKGDRQGPPPGDHQGPPPGDRQGPPPGDRQGPPPGDRQGPPPGDRQGPPPCAPSTQQSQPSN